MTRIRVPHLDMQPTAKAMHLDARVMVQELTSILGNTTPTAEEWRRAEGLALGILSAVRKGRSAQILVEAQAAARAKRESVNPAMMVQLDRMGMHETAERLQAPALNPIFEGICRAAGMQ